MLFKTISVELNIERNEYLFTYKYYIIENKHA